MEIQIQRTNYCCSNCSARNLEYSSGNFFEDPDKLTEYANPEDVVCITKVNFCKHKLGFSRPGVCVFGDCGVCLIINHQHLLSCKVYSICSFHGILKCKTIGLTMEAFGPVHGAKYSDIFKDNPILNGSLFTINCYENTLCKQQENKNQIFNGIKETLHNYEISYFSQGYYAILAKKCHLTKPARS
jgi:hypothetical protein